MNCLSLNLLTEMTKLRINRKSEKPGFVGSSGIFLLLVANFQFVATSVTWTAPPPAWEQTDPTDIRTVDKPVLNGSTQVALKWSYTLSNGSLISTRFSRKLNDGSFDAIGTISSGNTVVFNKNDYRTRFAISGSELATLIINKVTEREEAVYQCEVTTDSNVWNYRIHVIATVPVKLTNVSGNQRVLEGSHTTLVCKATGKPGPNTTFTRVLEDGRDGEVLHQGPTWNFPNINRTASGTYRCTAENKFENVSQVFKVNVTYPAKIVNLKREHAVAAQQRVNLYCQADGNPPPTYTWIPCDSLQSVCHKSELNFQASNESVYTFTCKVANNLGSDTRNTTLFIASDVINVTLVITGECTGAEFIQLWEKLSKMINEIFAGKLGYESVEQKNIRYGSGVIIDLALKFGSTVKESEVLSTLREAAKNGKFGDCNVTAITGTRYAVLATTMATTPTSPSDNTTWIIVGVVLGLAVLLVVAGVVAWHVYKKRKCKKRDSKVHNNGPQGDAGKNVQDEGYVEVNRGYEDRAKRHSGGGNPSSGPPVLYDTAQTGNRGADRGQPVAQYAVVDKSKKKPRKPKPGELQYAELAEFSAGQGGPRSSTSPINRPTEIQYADVNAM